MARFIARTWSRRGNEVHRLANARHDIQLYGWDAGIHISAQKDESGTDIFTILLTKGSNGAESRILGSFTTSEIRDFINNPDNRRDKWRI